MVAPALAAQNEHELFRYQEIDASAQNEASGDYIDVDVEMYSDGYIDLRARGDFNGESFDCDVNGPDLSDLVVINVNGSAKLGSAEIDTDGLDCDGTPPPMITVECIANGQESYFNVGSGRYSYTDDGTTITYSFHSVDNYQSADCTITADSLDYDQNNDDGGLWVSQEVEKEKEN